MSVSARSLSCTMTQKNDECTMTSANAESMRREWESIGGRLGTPDAAAPIDHIMKNSIANNNQPQQQQQPALNTEDLFTKLNEALSLESKFQPSLYLPEESQDGEVTIGTRDGAAHVLRCLKVWYDLPTDVLFAAINLVDRFLTKMKVKPKHIACISVGSLHLSTQQLGLPPLNTDDLVAISQCRRTSGDVERMSSIIANKLGILPNSTPVTALSFIRLFYNIFKNVANELCLSDFFNKSISLQDLEMRLEVLCCDASCANIRPSELALVLICTQMDAHINNFQGSDQSVLGLVDYAIEMQKLCRIPDSSFFHSHSTVVKILQHYNGQNKLPYKQRLVWKLSSRTMRLLRPTDRLTSYLPTIEEHNNNLANNLSRFRTGSVSSEDEDWPTSPVVPVCERC